MKIYTSYFAKQKDLEERGITCIGICAIPPKWFNGPNFVCIAPTKDILFEYKANPDKERYTKRYKEEVLCILKKPQISNVCLRFLKGSSLFGHLAQNACFFLLKFL